MNRITPEHLARSAYVDVRQPTADQLLAVASLEGRTHFVIKDSDGTRAAAGLDG